MADIVNYAEKYASHIDERFTTQSYTNGVSNADYEFAGVGAVNVYSSDLAELVDYDVHSTENRYGQPKELGDGVQNMKLTQDKAFTFTIDRRNTDDKMKANSSALALKRHIDNVIIPTIDKYRITRICENAGAVLDQQITSQNAYTSFLAASSILTNCKCPVMGRIAFVTPEYLKEDDKFTGRGDSANELAKQGVIDVVDGTNIIQMPVDYFPPGVNYIIVHPVAIVSPVKLAEYFEHENPPGINGWLVEGRVYFDAFVLNNKRFAIIVSKDKAAALQPLTVASAAGAASGDTKLTVTPALAAGNTYRYKLISADSAPVQPAYNQVCIDGWQDWNGTDNVTAATGTTIIVAEVGPALNAKAAGAATVTAKA